MSTQQLTLTEELEPRRFRRHTVLNLRGPWPKPAEPEILPLKYEEPGNKKASVFEIPWPTPAAEPERKVVQHFAHWCGLGSHWTWCVTPRRCTLREKAPCAACEEKVVASYRAGRYAVAR